MTFLHRKLRAKVLTDGQSRAIESLGQSTTASSGFVSMRIAPDKNQSVLRFRMNLLILLLVLLLLFGGGGFYWGGPAYGGGGIGLVLVICLIVLLAGGFRRRNL